MARRRHVSIRININIFHRLGVEENLLLSKFMALVAGEESEISTRSTHRCDAFHINLNYFQNETKIWKQLLALEMLKYVRRWFNSKFWPNIFFNLSVIHGNLVQGRWFNVENNIAFGFIATNIQLLNLRRKFVIQSQLLTTKPINLEIFELWHRKFEIKTGAAFSNTEDLDLA